MRPDSRDELRMNERSAAIVQLDIPLIWNLILYGFLHRSGFLGWVSLDGLLLHLRRFLIFLMLFSFSVFLRCDLFSGLLKRCTLYWLIVLCVMFFCLHNSELDSESNWKFLSAGSEKTSFGFVGGKKGRWFLSICLHRNTWSIWSGCFGLTFATRFFCQFVKRASLLTCYDKKNSNRRSRSTCKHGRTQLIAWLTLTHSDTFLEWNKWNTRHQPNVCPEKQKR